MKSDLPKQFMHLAGRPVLMHTLEVFHQFDSDLEFVLGMAGRYQEYWKDACTKAGFKISHRITEGGDTRFHTVKAALDIISPGSLVAVHDGVRPLVSPETIRRCFDRAARTGTAIPCVDIPESLRELDEVTSRPVDRNRYRLVQTPQVFRYDILAEAYRQDHDQAFTDDSTVVEKAGFKVSLVEGNVENIKITTPGDMLFAESLLNARRQGGS